MRPLIALLLVAGACRLGRPPAGGTYHVGRVVAATAEPGLRDDISAALASSLARRGALGAGVAVSVRVAQAGSGPLGADPSGVQVHEVRMTLIFQTEGYRPRRLELQGAQPFVISAMDPLGASGARAAAFARLAADLSDSAAEWILAAPAAPLPLPVQGGSP